jgi:uncharacterized repeat protein (TIGR02543 family)
MYRAARRARVVATCAVATFVAVAMSVSPVAAQLARGSRVVGPYSSRLDAPRGARLPFGGSAQAVCGHPGVGVAQCLSDILYPTGTAPESSTPTGLSPSRIESVYGYTSSSTAGSGQTIALVDAYNDPDAASDLNEFSAEYGLPSECTGGSSPPSCFEFTQVNETGGNNLPAGDAGWDLEISLDIEWAHALAPGANILLVEATSNSLSDLLAAEQYAAAHANYVSNSWGSSEFDGETLYDSYFSQPGVSYFAAAGDSGGTVLWPSASPDVISVGGTSLSFSSGGTLAQESAWNDGGGGCSSYETASTYQTTGSVSCAGMRATPDLSLDADPDSGVSVYDSVSYDGQTGWWTVGGTSASTPMVAARAAATGAHVNAQYVYSNPPNISFRDVITGSNGYPTLPGYDLATGLGAWSNTPGTPMGLNAKDVSGGVTLNWSAPSGAPVSGYTIWRGTASGEETTEIATVTAPTTTYSDTSVPLDTTFYYKVQAANDLGVGPFSNEASGNAPGPAYAVTFEANGGTGSMAVETEDEPTPLTANSFIRAGYLFSGWNTAANGAGTAYSDGASYPFTASVTLYAQWTADTAYTVSFEANGGTGSMAPETASEPTPLTTNSFVRTGYSFSDWNTSTNGSGTAYADGATYAFTASAALYAQWKASISAAPPAPTVTGISPTSGPVAGGTSITISGTGFSTTAGGSRIEFGTTSASAVICASTMRCTTTLPGEAAGTVEVVVTTPHGTSTASPADHFTYVPAPTITRLTPEYGPTKGGTKVTIRGDYFDGAISVFFGGRPATNTHVFSPSEITAVAPFGSGTVYVTVSSAFGSSEKTAAGTFTFVPPPTINEITPGKGPKRGGTIVTIRGTNLAETVSVYFGAKKARGFRVLSSRAVTAVAPSRPGSVYVTVFTVGGASKKTLASRFTFVARPTITKVTPDRGPKTGGTKVTIRGSNFVGTVSVYFGARKARSVHVLSSSEIIAIAPPRPGTVYVTVLTVGGCTKKTAATRYLYRVGA